MTAREKLQTAGITTTLAAAMFATICAFVRLFVCVLLVLSVATVARADDHDRSPLGVANFVASLTSVGLAGADSLITYKAVKAGIVHEANPWLVPHVKAHGIGKTMAAKFGINVGTELGFQYIEKRWPERKKTVLAARLATIAVNGYAVAHNLRVIRDAR